jgi:hypothetical protein
MSSLFKKQTEDLARFFLKAWDCGDYTYDTRKNVRDQIRNMCLNFLAGATPSFMQDVIDDKILDEGFSARTIFMFADKNRFNLATVPELDQEQKIAAKELLAHIKELITINGCCHFASEVDSFFDEWWPQFCDGKIPLVNSSSKLRHYYSRYLMHIKKVAMAMHFGETTNINQPISLSTVKSAMAWLADIEPQMHLALIEKSINPLVLPGQKLLTYLKIKEKATEVEIMGETFTYFKNFKEDFPDLLNAFLQQGKIEKSQGADGKIRYSIGEKGKKDAPISYKLE